MEFPAYFRFQMWSVDADQKFEAFWLMTRNHLVWKQRELIDVRSQQYPVKKSIHYKEHTSGLGSSSVESVDFICFNFLGICIISSFGRFADCK